MRIRCERGLRARIDPERMRQALDDLLDNALRHSAPGGTITLSAARSDGLVHLSVLDSGPGFPNDVIARTHAMGERTDGVDGALASGLGLRIAAAIARAHGGALRLENREEGGACASLDVTA
jgi:signal transduction histidine kinase